MTVLSVLRCFAETSLWTYVIDQLEQRQWMGYAETPTNGLTYSGQTLLSINCLPALDQAVGKVGQVEVLVVYVNFSFTHQKDSAVPVFRPQP